MPTVSTSRPRAKAPAPTKTAAVKASAKAPAKPAAKGTSKPAVKAKAATRPAVAVVPEHQRAALEALAKAAPPVGLVDDDLGPLPSNEVFDEADGAQHIQLRELADVQRRALQANRPESHPDFDGTHCVVCDAVIPTPRLLLFKVRCVDCQRELETQRNRLR